MRLYAISPATVLTPYGKVGKYQGGKQPGCTAARPDGADFYDSPSSGVCDNRRTSIALQRYENRFANAVDGRRDHSVYALPEFFGELWCGLRPLCDSQPFVDAVGEVRNFCEKIMLALNPPPLIERLAENGYGGREIDFPNLMIATLTRSLLLGGRFGRAGDNVPACEMRHAPDVAKPFVLMEH